MPFCVSDQGKAMPAKDGMRGGWGAHIGLEARHGRSSRDSKQGKARRRTGTQQRGHSHVNMVWKSCPVCVYGLAVDRQAATLVGPRGCWCSKPPSAVKACLAGGKRARG